MFTDVGLEVLALVYLLAGFCIIYTLRGSLRPWLMDLFARGRLARPDVFDGDETPPKYLSAALLLWPFSLFLLCVLGVCLRNVKKPQGVLFAAFTDAYDEAKKAAYDKAIKQVDHLFHMETTEAERWFLHTVVNVVRDGLSVDNQAPVHGPGLFGAVLTFRAETPDDVQPGGAQCAVSLTLHRELTVSTRHERDIVPVVVVTFGIMRQGREESYGSVVFDVWLKDDELRYGVSCLEDATPKERALAESVMDALFGDEGDGKDVVVSAATLSYLVRTEVRDARVAT